MESDLNNRLILASLLTWYEAMGVTSSESDPPIDWLARGNAAPGAAFSLGLEQADTALPPGESAKTSVTKSSAARMGSQDAVVTAPSLRSPKPSERAIINASSLEELRTALENFNGCHLKTTAKNLCFFRGAPQAKLMIIGEAPGRDEDIAGRPFVGRAGQLLDRMLAAISLGEAHVHITNIVYWRPPGNRTPTPQEALVCRPFLERQVELVQPDLVLLLGGAAAKHILDVPEGIMRLRGKWRELQLGSRQVRAMATLHPAYLLRTPGAKAMAWRDLLAVRAALDALGQ